MRSGSGWEVIADSSVVFESVQASGVRDARKQRFVESFGIGHLRRMAEVRKLDELGAADRPPSPIRDNCRAWVEAPPFCLRGADSGLFRGLPPGGALRR
jgi:hypothetical protein